MLRKLALMGMIAAAPVMATGAGQQGQQGQQRSDGQRATAPAGSEARAIEQFRAEEGFFTSPSYDIEGTVASVSEGEITIRRENLPEAKLSIASNTRIELDGEAASAQQLRPGQEVRATFNLQSDTPLALEIDAERRDDRQGGGLTGDRRDQNPQQPRGNQGDR